MRFNEKWLREWVNPGIDTATLCHHLTMAGLEVDAVEPVAQKLDNVVVGRVLHVEPHPDADRLRVCQVEVGANEILTIVCGAANVARGMHVPTAKVGAVLPGGLTIKRAKLRGVESSGMLCSAKELGLAESAEGLMPLPEGSPVGMNIGDYLELDDVAIELGLTPNRGDCLSVRGIARDVAAVHDCPLDGPAIEPVAPTIDDRFAVAIQAKQACPRYVGRVIRNINPQAETPLWMQEQLRRCGLRSIHPVVDVTNYVLLELGQPMHAFDLDKLAGGIEVRTARGNEKITLLDDSEVTPDETTLVIADNNGPVALAGVMGGAASAVSEITTSLFMEAAFFAPQAMAGRARRYGLHTDSSHRFERGVDPRLAQEAMERATALLLGIVGGEAGPLIDCVHEDVMPALSHIVLRGSRVRKLLGYEIADGDIAAILTRLGMQIEPQAQGAWQVTPPSYRFDVTIEADLIEELARIGGYDAIPVAQPPMRLGIDTKPETALDSKRVATRLIDLGFNEAVTYSFVDEALNRLLCPDEEPIRLSNPISSDMGVMRTTLWAGLLSALVYNRNRQQERIRLFEIGSTYHLKNGERSEPNRVAGVCTGLAQPEQWSVKAQKIDFYDAKGYVEALLGLTSSPADFIFKSARHPALHPGQSAKIEKKDGRFAGWVGMVHPVVLAQLGISGDVAAFELSLQTLGEVRLPAFGELSRYPAIRRDLALVVEETITAAEIMQCIVAESGELLKDLQLFDVYRGEGIDSGRKSLALGLTLQDTLRTLTDDDVNNLVERVLVTLKNQFKATLRD